MQSIGERLEEARKRKGVTIREASEATKIRGEYLASFENNNFAISVPEIYVRGFLRSYSNFLKISSEKILTDYAANLIGEAKSAKREHREFFGRMELQQPLVQDPKKAATIVDDEVHQPEETQGNFFTNLDREVLIKGGIVAVVAIICLVGIIWAVRVAIGGDTPTIPATNETPSQNTPAAAKDTVRLFATGDVRVTVTERNTGMTLLSLHPLAAGQSVAVERSGPIRIAYTAGENLQVEVKGARYGTGKTGEGANTIP